MRRILAGLLSGVVLSALAAAVGPPASAVPGQNLLPAPPMGWNSWNKFGCAIDENLIRQTADAMVAHGMRDAGYRYLNIDDCWMAPARDANGDLQPDPKRFPHGIAALADYAHARGLKLGIYSSAGTKTCAGFPASLDHETADARKFAQWGVDYLKYDNCNNEGRPATERYQAMSDALRATGRPIVLSLCEWGENEPWLWGARYGELWRTTGDISDNWNSFTKILDEQVGLEQYSGPNAWNDPDMLEVGNGGMTDAEYRAHFSLWALLNAPLIAGNDLRSMDPATAKILENKDLIALDQDWGGKQGHKIRDDGDVEVWAKPMSDGSAAVVLFNRGGAAADVAVRAADLGIRHSGQYRVRDLWSGEESHSAGDLHGTVAAHGAVVYRVWPGGGARTPLTTLALSAPEVTATDHAFTVTTTLHNDGSPALQGGSARLTVPSGWAVDHGATVPVPRTTSAWTHQWTVRPTGAQPAGPLALSAEATFSVAGETVTRTAAAPVLAATVPPAGQSQVSALPFVSSDNGWGPVERDTSNGETAAGDGHPITIAGVRYPTGLGAHAPSSVRVFLGGGCRAFTAKTGVDDESGGGTVTFEVWGDGKRLASTGVQRHGAAAAPLTADLTGVTVADLRVTDAGDGNTYDHADWADAAIDC
ncbi:NPCBM/NEW2 domain-containing protein [Amycolatopsis benzoatilytica]|uniref:NPCBM/NEW2 domain-containing protein n=1 Tax=Amycolatopsis benzoatilytica TaxID=346045 RepID=UPI00036F0C2B|nr:NPCBM/NEW2 domain-containing protein [Amycolatopsis benzoatilytica]